MIMCDNIARRVLATFYRSTSPRCGATLGATTPITCPEFLRQSSLLSRRTEALHPSLINSNHVISRSFAAGGFLGVAIRPSSAVARTVALTCAGTVERTRISTHRALDRRKVTYELQVARQRAFHGSGRYNSPPQSEQDGKTFEESGQVVEDGKSEIANGKGVKSPKAVPRTAKGFAAASAVNKHVMDRLPSMRHIHRPSKEELLAAATGFWSRLKVHFKWFSIRSVRPFNMDEIGAFFSWFVLGHVIWIIVGTTTFFSLAIFAVNTVFAQGNPSEYALTLHQADPVP